MKIAMLSMALFMVSVNTTAQTTKNGNPIATFEGATGMEEFAHTDVYVNLDNGEVKVAHYKVFIGVKDNKAVMLSYIIYKGQDKFFEPLSNGCVVPETPSAGFGNLLDDFTKLFLTLPGVQSAIYR